MCIVLHSSIMRLTTTGLPSSHFSKTHRWIYAQTFAKCFPLSNVRMNADYVRSWTNANNDLPRSSAKDGSLRALIELSERSSGSGGSVALCDSMGDTVDGIISIAPLFVVSPHPKKSGSTLAKNYLEAIHTWIYAFRGYLLVER